MLSRLILVLILTLYPTLLVAQQQASGADEAKPAPKDKGLAGTWLGLQAGLRFPLACNSGEPVHYSADGTYTGPGARGTWQLQNGELTEIVKELDAEIGDPASVKIGEPYESRIEWKGPDTFVRTSPGGASMTFRRCPETASVSADAAAENAARSKAAAYLIREQISAACEMRDGSIDPASVIERDLNGDGKADLIIHHHGIECAGGGRSIFCGAQACSFLIYVRRGALLRPAGEFLGVETIKVEGGPIPTIHTVAHGGRPTALRWNGREFRWR